MRKFLPWLVVAALLIVSVVPALALPTSDLNSLARYYPDDTALFVSMQFDSDLFEQVDSVIAHVADALPSQMAVPRGSIIAMLDDELEMVNLSFAEDIEPLLGGTLAVGMLKFNVEELDSSTSLRRDMQDEPAIVALSISDSAAVDAFLQNLMAQASDPDEVIRTEGDGFISYVNADNDEVSLILHDDALLFSNDPNFSGGALPSSSLADNPAFNDAYSILPESDYVAAMYLDLPGLIAQAGDEIAAFPAISDFINDLGPVVGGFTLIDDLHMVFDIAIAAELSSLNELGLSTDVAPVDPAFARFIPADSAIVGIQSSLANQYQNMLAQLQLQASLMQTAMNLDSSAMDMSMQDMDEVMAQLDEFKGLFQEYTGLDLEEDVFAWMTGPYASFFSLNPDMEFTNQFSLFANLPIDFGLVVEATDPQAAAITAAGLVKGLDRLLVPMAAQDDAVSVDFSTETISGTEVNVISISADELPWPVDILLGSNDEILVLGTRGAVSRVLRGDGMLNNSPSFIRAQAFALENNISFGFFDPAPLMPLTNILESMASNDDEMAEITETVRAVINLIDSLSISQSVTDQSLHGRLVFSLAE